MKTVHHCHTTLTFIVALLTFSALSLHAQGIEREIVLGDRITGNIRTDVDEDVYQFFASANQTLSLTIAPDKKSKSLLTPSARLINLNTGQETPLPKADPKKRTIKASGKTAIKIPDAPDSNGTYCLIISRAANTTENGGYIIKTKRKGAGPIKLKGEPLPKMITFGAEPGALLSVKLQHDTMALSATLQKPDGAEVQLDADNKGRIKVKQMELDQLGTYVINATEKVAAQDAAGGLTGLVSVKPPKSKRKLVEGPDETTLPTAAPANFTDGGYAAQTEPLLQFDLTDAGSGINPRRFTMKINGNDVTSLCTFYSGADVVPKDGCAPPDRVECQLDAASALTDVPNGNSIELDLTDNDGNAASESFTLHVDAAPPTISIDAPSGVTDTNTPSINVSFSDDGSGIDKTGFRLMLGGVDRTDECVVTEASAQYQVDAEHALPEGGVIIAVWIRDKAGNQNSDAKTPFVDTTAPSIVIDSPTDMINVMNPLIQISYGDPDGSGIDLGAFELRVNGVDRTEDCTVTATGAECQISWEEPLLNGNNTIAASIKDLAGHEVSDANVVFVDAAQPTISIKSPIGAIATTTPLIDVTFHDGAGSGIDPSTFTATINGVDRSAMFTVTDTGAQWQVDEANALPTGDNIIAVRIRDKVGYESGDTEVVFVAYVLAKPVVSGATGYAPFTVTFTSRAETNHGPIRSYEWDFESDGLYDTYDRVATNYQHTYPHANIDPDTVEVIPYQAKLRVTTEMGNADVATVEILVHRSPPNPAAQADPSHGGAPLLVRFTGSGNDPDGTIVLYEWDFDGDGAYDYSSPSSPGASYIYRSLGTYVAVFRVTDNDGFTATAPTDATTIALDSSIRSLPSAIPTSGNAPLTVTFIPNAEDPNSAIQSFEWDFEADGSYDTYDQFARQRQYTYPQAKVDPNTGQVIPYKAALRVTNAASDVSVDVIDILVHKSPPEATGQVDPSNGGAPLTANFTGSGTDPDGAIALYEWDFDGDGAYDYSDPTSPDATHTYNSQGTYAAVLRVTDNDGLTGVAPTDTTTVVVGQPGSPTAHAAARIPIETNLSPLPGVTANASSNDPYYPPQRGIDGDLWTSWLAADGDAANLGTRPYFTIVFPTDQFVTQINIRGNRSNLAAGHDSFRGGFELFDRKGVVLFSQEAELPGPYRDLDLDIPDTNGVRKVQFTSLDDEGGSPGFAELQVIGYEAATSGVAPFTVSLVGAGTDPDGAIVLYEWDFEGDGTYDYSSPTDGTTTHTYTAGGKFYPTLRVTDNSGLTGVGKTEITTTVGVALSISDPDYTVNPTNGETTDVQTSYSAQVPVSILIKDSEGNVVRKLVDDQTRPGGAYNDSWDGRDENGLILNDGVYYAILEYNVNGEAKTLDLADTTGGARRRPRVQGTTYSSPYDDDFLELQYSLDRASEVTLFGALFYGMTNVRTVLNRAPRPAGNHVEYWDGLDDEHRIAHAPPPDNLVFVVYAYTLPDNAIFLTGGRPVISNVSADPNYLDPSTTCGSEGKTTVSYDVSEDVTTVELRVVGLEDGKIIRTITQTNVTAGANAIEWDGRNNDGRLVEKQDFQLGLIATDSEGNKSLIRYVLVRLFY